MATPRPHVSPLIFPDISKAILLAFRGSVAHGMYVPNTDPHSIDDIDLMGVVVPGPEHYFGLEEYGSRGTKEHMLADRYDIVAYEARKFIGLLAQGNPNVLSMLWLEPEDYLHRTPAGNLLIEQRYLFSGKHVYHAFTSYAHAQIKKIIPGEFKGYMGSKRKALVEKFGFDCKNSAHAIRLLRMGIEFLQDGRLNVRRKDADELLAIKRGQVPLNDILLESNDLFAKAEAALRKSQLPDRPDRRRVSELCVTVVRAGLNL